MKSFNIYMCGSKQQSRFEGEEAYFRHIPRQLRKFKMGNLRQTIQNKIAQKGNLLLLCEDLLLKIMPIFVKV